jgi:hypothetical protein
MPRLNPNQRIYDVLTEIDRGAYRLPNIQRGFEWEGDRICKLLDSVLHEYPIGAIMVWLPTDAVQGDIQTRSFVKDFDTSQDYLSQPAHPNQQESYLVLDGQQRLQSLYIAFYGTYDGRSVYFHIDYTPSSDAEDDGPFELLGPKDASAKPELIHPAQLIKLDYRTKFDFAEERAAALCANLDDAVLKAQHHAAKRSAISRNIDLFIESFNMRPVLLIQEVSRQHSYDQVLEIFQRVNSGGMKLSKSDLMFCTLKLKIQDMEERFSNVLSAINQAGRFAFTRDFLIKASLVVFGQGAQYEVHKLRNDDFIAKLRDGFDMLEHCLRHLLTWLETHARINNARFLRSENALIPLLDYMYRSGKHDTPEGADSLFFLQYLYMSFLTRLFSRGGDSTLDRLCTTIRQAIQAGSTCFPIGVVRDYICKRMNVNWELAEYHFADDPELMLNIVDNGALQLNAQQHEDQKLERDHIFPRKILVNQGFGDGADHIGNYRLVVMPINRRKRADMPTTSTDFYGRHDEQLEPLYQAAIANLNRETYEAFRDERASRIIAAVNEFLDLDQTATNPDTGTQAAAASTDLATDTELAGAGTQHTRPDISAIPAVTDGISETVNVHSTPEGSQINLEGLKKAYAEDAEVRLLIDHFGSRQRNQNISPVETLERALDAAGTPLARHLIIAGLRRLDALGIGRFVPGRKGYPTRFEWDMKSLQVRALAKGYDLLERSA